MGAEAGGRESNNERAHKELKPQLSTTSADAMFSAPGPMQTSTPGMYIPVITCLFLYQKKVKGQSYKVTRTCGITLHYIS